MSIPPASSATKAQKFGHVTLRDGVITWDTQQRYILPGPPLLPRDRIGWVCKSVDDLQAAVAAGGTAISVRNSVAAETYFYDIETARELARSFDVVEPQAALPLSKARIERIRPPRTPRLTPVEIIYGAMLRRSYIYQPEHEAMVRTYYFWTDKCDRRVADAKRLGLLDWARQINRAALGDDWQRIMLRAKKEAR